MFWDACICLLILGQTELWLGGLYSFPAELSFDEFTKTDKLNWESENNSIIIILLFEPKPANAKESF